MKVAVIQAGVRLVFALFGIRENSRIGHPESNGTRCESHALLLIAHGQRRMMPQRNLSLEPFDGVFGVDNVLVVDQVDLFGDLAHPSGGFHRH